MVKLSPSSPGSATESLTCDRQPPKIPAPRAPATGPVQVGSSGQKTVARSVPSRCVGPEGHASPRYRIRAACAPRYTRMTPHHWSTHHEARIEAHAQRVQACLKDERKQRGGRPPGKVGRPGRPVVSDRGEWFPSASDAAKAMFRNRTSVFDAILSGGQCGGRRWRWVERNEDAA